MEHASSWICVAVITTLLFPIFSSAQKDNRRYDVPPSTPPSSCGLSLISVQSSGGTPAYRRLAFQLQALQSAQEAVVALKQGMESLKDPSAPPTLAISGLLTGLHEAQDDLLCSASIIAAYKPTDRDDRTLKSLLIVAYNQERAALSDLQAHFKEQLLRSEKASTQAVLVKDAERLTTMKALQQEAADTIFQVTPFSLMLSVDLSKPDAKNTALTVLPCEEFDKLKNESADLSHSTKSAYTDAASLFVMFFESHKCAQPLNTPEGRPESDRSQQ